jgi:hypothetical protein
VFDVHPNAIKLGAIPDPTIKALILPKVLPCPPEKLVGLAGGDAFQTVCNAIERDGRIQKNVNVVGHDGESSKQVLLQFSLASI